MIREVIIRRFKRFEEATFRLDGHLVLAGPNNCGKTTMLQAISSWSLALDEWRQLWDPNRRNGAYSRKPVARQAFLSVPLLRFEQLWHRGDYRKESKIEIEILTMRGERVAMEFIPDSTEQIYVRPTGATDPEVLANLRLPIRFLPPTSGLALEEPVYQPKFLDLRLGRNESGAIVRNLLLAVAATDAWTDLSQSLQRMFAVEILVPDGRGAVIRSEYRDRHGLVHEIGSAGSGFVQVLGLLAFLYGSPAGSVLLVDEPDAHLHVILQDTIYSELRRIAQTRGAQLIIATHSEVVINAVPVEDLCTLLDQPRPVAGLADHQALMDALRLLTQLDLLLAVQCPGVLYLEGHTDLELLRVWAERLEHPARRFFERELFWKPTIEEHRLQGRGVKGEDHFRALQLVRGDFTGVILRDRDQDPRIPVTPAVTRGALNRLRWRRYEIEAYLFHPAAMERWVRQLLGGDEADPGALAAALEGLRAHFAENYLPTFLENPHSEPAFISGLNRDQLIAAPLAAAGFTVDYTRYSGLAGIMEPGEIHPEVREKLDFIQQAFGL